MSRPQYNIVELYGPDDLRLPRFVQAGIAGQDAPWRLAWQHRLPSRLVSWLLTLNGEPVERVLLGNSVQLTEAQARSIVGFRLQEIARMAGCPAGTWPSFLLNEPPTRGKARPVVLLQDGRTRRLPSQHAAARVLGISQPAVYKAIRRGHGAFDAAANE